MILKNHLCDCKICQLNKSKTYLLPLVDENGFPKDAYLQVSEKVFLRLKKAFPTKTTITQKDFYIYKDSRK